MQHHEKMKYLKQLFDDMGGVIQILGQRTGEKTDEKMKGIGLLLESKNILDITTKALKDLGHNPNANIEPYLDLMSEIWPSWEEYHQTNRIE